jgi:tellurite resistance protein TerC
MIIPEFWLYAGFLFLVSILLALDLGVFNKTPRVVSIGSALGWTAFWISLALSFNGLVYYMKGPQAAKEFFAGYLLEQSLSVDNIFVIILVLRFFKVPPQYHHKVLFWGIVGAVVMRGTMIALGSALIANFAWMYFVFGAFLVFTGIRMAFSTEEARNLEDNFVVDSIPAIFAVTNDPFIVFTSNIFAVMGLRSLFFAVAGVMRLFHYLKYGLSLILTFIGVKMFIQQWIHMPVEIALTAIAVILALSILASVVFPEKKATQIE